MAQAKTRHKRSKKYSKKNKRLIQKNYAKKDTTEFAELAKSLKPVNLADIPELADYTEEVAPEKPIIRNFAYAAEPSKEIAVSLNQTIGCCRVLYNMFVEHLYKYLESIGYTGGLIIGYKVPSYKKMMDAVGKDYMYKPDKFAYNNVMNAFDAAVKAYNEQYALKGKQYTKRAIRRANNGGDPLTFRDLKGMPKFHAKHYCVDSYKSSMSHNNIKLNTIDGEDIYDENWHHGNYKHFHVRATLKLPKIPKFDIILHRPLPKGSRIKTVTITREKAGNYTATIAVELETRTYLRLKKTPEAQEAMRNYLTQHPKLALGLDYAQKDGCVGSEEKILSELIDMAFGKNFRHMEVRLAALQRKQRRKEWPDYKQGFDGSGSYQKSQQRIAKLHKKVANRRKDALDKLSTVIANSFLLVAVEDIDLRAMSQLLTLAKNLLDNGFGMFRDMLKYKLEEQGKPYVVIDKWFASTQTCNNCGYINTETKNLAVKEWNCPHCGVHHGRDKNAAMNIRDEGIRTIEKAQIFEIKTDDGKTAATTRKYQKKSAA